MLILSLIMISQSLWQKTAIRFTLVTMPFPRRKTAFLTISILIQQRSSVFVFNILNAVFNILKKWFNARFDWDEWLIEVACFSLPRSIDPSIVVITRYVDYSDWPMILLLWVLPFGFQYLLSDVRGLWLDCMLSVSFLFFLVIIRLFSRLVGRQHLLSFLHLWR